MVMNMLWVFDFVAHALLDANDKLSFLTTYIAIRFDKTPKILLEPF